MLFGQQKSDRSDYVLPHEFGFTMDGPISQRACNALIDAFAIEAVSPNNTGEFGFVASTSARRECEHKCSHNSTHTRWCTMRACTISTVVKIEHQQSGTPGTYLLGIDAELTVTAESAAAAQELAQYLEVRVADILKRHMP